jgi:hypothetical protein
MKSRSIVRQTAFSCALLLCAGTSSAAAATIEEMLEAEHQR